MGHGIPLGNRISENIRSSVKEQRFVVHLAIELSKSTFLFSFFVIQLRDKKELSSTDIRLEVLTKELNKKREFISRSTDICEKYCFLFHFSHL